MSDSRTFQPNAAGSPGSSGPAAAGGMGFPTLTVRLPAWARGAVGRLAVPVVLALCAFVLYVVRLDVPNQYIYDEVYHAYTAGQYVDGNEDAYVWYTQAPQQGVAYEWTHPPLGKLLIAGGIEVFGNNSFGWRIASAVFGAIGIGLAYCFGLRMTGSRLIGFFTALLLMVDGLYFVESRTGMADIFVLVFTLGALFSAYDYLTLPAVPGPARWALVRTGLLLGLALATKWNAAYAAGLIGLAVVAKVALLWWQGGTLGAPPRVTRTERPVGPPKRGARGASAKPNYRRDATVAPERPGGSTARLRKLLARDAFWEQVVWIPIGLALVPALIYWLSYGPFFLAGHSWDQFTELQRQMWEYHSNLKATHAYASDWWQWPLDWKPVWYYVNYGPTERAYTYANGNPLLFWVMVPAVLWVCWIWWREKRFAALTIMGIGFFGQWLPWALSPRISFVYHFLPAVPFGALAVAVVLQRLWFRSPATRYAAGTYVLAVVIAFAFFYPIYAAVPLTPDRLELRYWFDSWR